MKTLSTVKAAIQDHNRLCLLGNIFHQGEHGNDGKWMTFEDDLFNKSVGKWKYVALGVLVGMLIFIALISLLFLGYLGNFK